MKQKILDLYFQQPRRFSRTIKETKDLHAWVLENADPRAKTWLEKLHTAIHGSLVCPNGKPRRVLKFGKLGYCGKMNKCECARREISQKISKQKQEMTAEAKKQANQKRIATNIKKYGVSNTGQTQQARDARQKLYQDRERRENLIQKRQATFLEKYNSTSPFRIPEIQKRIQETMIRRHGVPNPQQNPEIKKKTAQTRKQNYDCTTIFGKNYEKLKSKLYKDHNLELCTPKQEYKGVAERPKLKYRCCVCSHEFTLRFDYANFPRCKRCYPTAFNRVSAEETELADYVRSLGFEVQSSNRSLIYPLEIDIIVEQKKLAIEYCGIYYHSEIRGGKKWRYHWSKYQKMKDLGYQLLTIFSDEWVFKKDIVKNILRAKLGVQNRIFARQCEVRSLSRDETKLFLNNNHLLGAPRYTSERIGLFDNNQLVAVMVFKNRGSYWELTRFCSQGTIVGGASRLLKAFERKFPGVQLVSFSDNRWSDGDLYKALGFVQTGIVPPMQMYCDNENRYPKHFQNRDYTITEWEQAQNAGYDRIWDCGKIKWTK